MLKAGMIAVLATACVLLLPMTTALRKQKVSAKGRVFCGETPASNVRVKLVDDDTGPDPDDELDAGYTDSNGQFHLSGDTRELTSIDPILKIYHDCNDYGIPCQRKWRITIPDDYINSNKVFDLGNVNLEVELDDEERDCIH